ncbi:immunoglobulin-like domain-containing protein [Paenibacillus koleovorans]|uniref:immunoglobulin-like domain-containing protein n=1 Tax=Paenibacillus koleovorans TaxID=121608 RepID=UPI000FD9054D|nr:immunoglobulin-like domain-containing protein [Paenibacillus koleovorans]
MKRWMYYWITLFSLLGLLLSWSPTVQASTNVAVQDNFTTKSNLWDYAGTASRTSEGTVQLTPPTEGMSGALWLKEAIAPPYTVTFKLRMSQHKYYNGAYVPADGITFMFNKAKYASIPYNSVSGFEIGNGYGVEFDTYVNMDQGQYWDAIGTEHITLFKNSPNSVASGEFLQQAATPSSTNNKLTNGEWHDVHIEVKPDSVKVYLDDQLYIDKNIELDQTYSYLGFSAGTGWYYSRQEIDDVSIHQDRVTRVFTSASPGNMTSGSEIPIYVQFNQLVKINSASQPRLLMNTGGYAEYVSGSGTDVLTFRYIVRENDPSTPLLNYAASSSLFSEAIYLMDDTPVQLPYPELYSSNSLAGTPVAIKMNEVSNYLAPIKVMASGDKKAYRAGAVIPIQVRFPAAVQVGGTPILHLNTGKFASYVSGSETNTLTFEYVVGDDDQTDLLNYESVNALQLNGGYISAMDQSPLITILPLTTSGSSLASMTPITLDQTIPEVTFQLTPLQTPQLGKVNIHSVVEDAGGTAGMEMKIVIGESAVTEGWIPYESDYELELSSATDYAEIGLSVRDRAGNETNWHFEYLYPPEVFTGKGLALGSAIRLPANEATALVRGHEGSIAEDFTITMWVKPENIEGYPLYYQPGDGDSPYRKIWLSTYYGQTESGSTINYDLWLYDGTTYYQDHYSSSTVIPYWQWSHLAFVQSNGQFSLYINGALDTPDTKDFADDFGPYTSSSSQPIQIGNPYGGGETSFGMGRAYTAIDDLQIWHKALLFHLDENLDYATPVTPNHPYYDYLKAYYPMNEVVEGKVADAIGDSDGLLYGSKYYFVNNPHTNLPYTHMQGQPLTGTLEASDEQGSTLTFVIESQATRGTVVLENPATSAFRYTTTGPTYGEDSFSYYVWNGVLRSATATAYINTLSVESQPIISNLLITPDPTIPTKGETVSIAVSVFGYPTQIGWLPGLATEEDFLACECLGPLDSNNDYAVHANGFYTVYIANTIGSVVRTFEITHFDRIRPELVLNGGSTLTVWQNDPFVDPGYSVTDNDSVEPTVLIEGSVNVETIGEYQLVYTATDRAGNITTITRTVTVQPKSANATLSSLTVNGQSVPDFTPTTLNYTVQVGYDTRSAALQWTVSDAVYASSASTWSEVGSKLGVGRNSYTVTVTAQNNSQLVYTVHIERDGRTDLLGAPGYSPIDREYPARSVFVTAAINGTDFEPVVRWLAGEQDQAAFAEEAGNPYGDGIEITQNGIYTLYAENIEGGYDLEVFQVDNIDRIAPAISFTNPSDAAVTLWVNDSYSDPAFTLSDNVDSLEQLEVVREGSVSLAAPGVSSLSYYARDRAGNISDRVYVTVTVNQKSSNANLYLIYVNDIYLTPLDPDVTVYTVNVGYDRTSISLGWGIYDFNSTATWSGPLSNLAVGSNTFTITVTAQDGTQKIYTIYVIRAELDNPVIENITFTPSAEMPTNQSVTINATVSGSYIQSFRWVPGQATASDFLNEATGQSVESSGFLATANGIYTLYARNVQGGYDLKIVEVKHIDTTAPTLQLADPEQNQITIWVGEAFPPLTWNLTDNMDQLDQLNLTSGGWDGNTHKPGTYAITYYAMDRAGNESQPVTIIIHILAKSSNADLSEVYLFGRVLDGFDPAVTTYTIPVDYDTTSASLSWTTAEPTYATVSWTAPEGGLKPGINTYSLTVHAQDGTQKTYTIHIDRATLNDPILENISLDPAYDVPSREVTVSATVVGDHVGQIRWLQGYLSEEEFANGAGSPLGASGFQATENGYYTLFVENIEGGYDLEVVWIDNIDRTAPILQLVDPQQAAVTIWAGDTFSPSMTWSDNYDMPEQMSLTHTGFVNAAVPGEYTISYYANDRAGNVSEPVTIKVTVVAPVATLTELRVTGYTLAFDPTVMAYTLSVPYETTSIEVHAAAADPIRSTAAISGPVGNLQVGSNIVKITVTPQIGTPRIYTIEVIRAGLPAPVIANVAITPPADTPTRGSVTVTMQVYGTHITAVKWLPGTASPEAFASSGFIVVNNSFAIGENGEYTIWVQNEVGAYALRTVTVQHIDRQAPDLQLLGPLPMNIPLGSSYTEPGYTVTDNLDAVEQIAVTITGSVYTNGIGQYNLLYTAIDRAGNTATAVRQVNVYRPLSDNANLSLLAVQGIPLEFQPQTLQYQIQVPYEVTALTIGYAPQDAAAQVTVTGAVYQANANTVAALLQPGPNVVQFQVTAENGIARTYTINITRMSSTNAYIAQFDVLGSVLSPSFTSDTIEYDLFIPNQQNQFISFLKLSDPGAQFTVTGVTYTVTSVTYGTATGFVYNSSQTVTGATYGLTFDFTGSSGFLIQVTAADGVTTRSYYFRLDRQPAGPTAGLSYARMLDARSIELRFLEGVKPGNLSLTGQMQVLSQGIPIPVSEIKPVFTGTGVTQVVIRLAHPVSDAYAPMSLSILPGPFVTTAANAPVSKLHIPVMNLANVNALYGAMDTMQNGLHIDDVLRFIRREEVSKDLNGDGQYDREDMQLMLSLIVNQRLQLP